MMNHAGFHVHHCLLFARRPADDGFHDLGVFSQSKVQPKHALAGVAIARRDDLKLLLGWSSRCLVSIPTALCADRAAVAETLFLVRPGAAGQLKLHPIAAGGDRVFVNQQWPFLVRHHGIEHAPIEQIGQHDGAAIVLIGGATATPTSVKPPPLFSQTHFAW